MNTITGDDWKRQLAAARRTPNSISEQIRKSEDYVVALEKEVSRLKTGIIRNDITMIVDGNDMCDWGWMTQKDFNLRINQMKLKPENDVPGTPVNQPAVNPPTMAEILDAISAVLNAVPCSTPIGRFMPHDPIQEAWKKINDLKARL